MFQRALLCQGGWSPPQRYLQPRSSIGEREKSLFCKGAQRKRMIKDSQFWEYFPHLTQITTFIFKCTVIYLFALRNATGSCDVHK